MDDNAVKEQVKSSAGLTVNIISPKIGDDLTKDSVIEIQILTSDDDCGTDVDDFAPSQLSHRSIPETNMEKNNYEQGPTIAGLQTTIAEQGTTIAEQGKTIAGQCITIAGLQATVAEQGTTIAEQGIMIVDLQTTVAEQGTTIAEQGIMIAEQGIMIVDLQTTNLGLQTSVLALKNQASDHGSMLEELRYQMREAAVEKSAQEIICGLQDVNSWRRLEVDQRIRNLSLSNSFSGMRTARNDAAHFILSEDQTVGGGTVAAHKAKMFAAILRALTTEITQGIAQKGVAQAHAIVQAVCANLGEFSGSSMAIPDNIAAEANQFFKYTLRLLGKNSAIDLL